MKIKEIVSAIEQIAPLQFQESYDNAGLLVGDFDDQVSGVLLCVDVTEAVIDEALSKKLDLIIAHHPLIFSGLKKINSSSFTGRCVLKAIRNRIAIYAAHTNIDSAFNGVSSALAKALGLVNLNFLKPSSLTYTKLVTFVSADYADKVRSALFEAGAGHIGNYDCCSYNIAGQGTFRGLEGANPFVGKKGQIHVEPEVRIEVILPSYNINSAIAALKVAHPYEEPAYDLYRLENTFAQAGLGVVGELPSEMDEQVFLQHLKKKTGAKVVRHTSLTGNPVKKIAVCGGSGSEFIGNAISARADVFVTADVKYHQFFEADSKLLLADIGHYESEQFVTTIFYDLLNEKFPKFAIHFSDINTNPINYL